MNEKFVIVNAAQEKLGMNSLDRGLFWSNDIGWVDFHDATQFTQEEKEFYGNNIPVDGIWLDLEIASAIVARIEMEKE
jgi:hypothetical protein